MVEYFGVEDEFFCFCVVGYDVFFGGGSFFCFVVFCEVVLEGD